MDIQDDSFEEHRIEHFCMGAGVIPISSDDDGNVRVLLGRERWIPQWKGSCRWSGFEGARKPDENVVLAATREFMEESLGVVDVVPRNADRVQSFLMLAHRIRMGRYWRRIVLRIQNDRRPERYHCTYVLPVPWDSTAPERFQTLRSQIEQLDRLIQEFRYLRPRCLGDASEHVGPIAIDPSLESARVEKLASTAPCILRAPWSIVEQNVEIVSATFLAQADVDSIVAWNTVRERLERAIIDHPAVRVIRDVRWKGVQDVSIERDYLEKDQIRWWSTDDLIAVIAGRGQLGPERFRPYFLPVLQTVLAKMGLDLSPPLCEPAQSDPEDEEARNGSPPPRAPTPE